jgi:type VI secretion system secreted protein Hcp
MAFDTFLQIEGLPGECLDAKHKAWIQLFSFSHAVNQVGDQSASAIGARTAGKCDHGDFHVTKTLDKCSPFLLNKACTGKHYPKAVIEVCKNTGNKELFYKIEFEHVVVSGVSCGGGQGQEAPMESVSFSYSKIKWNYTCIDPGTGAKGATAAAWWNIQTSEGG